VTDCDRREHNEIGSNRVHVKRLLRTKAAAAYLSVSPWKIRALVADGKLPVIQPDNNSPFLFDVRDLDRWADRHKRQ
jgi:excisionase family DNA binding protein